MLKNGSGTAWAFTLTGKETTDSKTTINKEVLTGCFILVVFIAASFVMFLILMKLKINTARLLMSCFREMQLLASQKNYRVIVTAKVWSQEFFLFSILGFIQTKGIGAVFEPRPYAF
jgi:hypothetical protein